MTNCENCRVENSSLCKTPKLKICENGIDKNTSLCYNRIMERGETPESGIAKFESEVFVMKRKVYWSVEKSVWGAIKPVHYYFRQKKNAEMFAHENEYCGCPEKHNVSLNVYEQMIFED